MFPGRFWLAVGSGESLNEQITGELWPRKEERIRQARLVILRSLEHFISNHDPLADTEAESLHHQRTLRVALSTT